MATLFGKHALQKSTKIGILLGKQLSGGHVSLVQVATLRATYGEPFGYKKPFPYKDRPLTFASEWFDLTKPRMNENSKIILVDGNIAVGKNDFAERLARNFDLRYYPSVPDSRVFVETKNLFDVRKLNDLLPDSCKFYDLNDFYADKDSFCGRIGNMQFYWFMKRFENYMSACLHLLSTGQGVVIAQSVFSDIVYLDALLKNNYIKPKWYDWMEGQWKNLVCDLMPPHLCIYLTCPIDVVKERIKKRNDPREINTTVLTDQYLRDLDHGYRNKLKEYLERASEPVEIDWTERGDDLDVETIAEELEGIRLENIDAEEDRFREWRFYSEDDLAGFRKRYHDRSYPGWVSSIALPDGCPECHPANEDKQMYDMIYVSHPALCREPGQMKHYRTWDDLISPKYD